MKAVIYEKLGTYPVDLIEDVSEGHEIILRGGRFFRLVGPDHVHGGYQFVATKVHNVPQA